MLHVNALLAVLSVCIHSVTGFSSGKVSVACGDMVPQHGNEPSPAPPPYNLTVDKSTFSPGDHITVSLHAASSSFFRGFLIEARDAAASAVGSFLLTDPYQSQLLQCGHTQGSAVSHRGSSRKTHVQVVWVSPPTPPHRVQFVLTVVQQYKVYWVRIAGPVVTLNGATVSPSIPAPTTTSTAAPSAPPLPPQFSSAGCGHSKSCLRDPAGCRPEFDPRCFFLSFTADEAGQSVMFELSGPADGYLSFALSLDKWMGNDEVYLCVNNGGRVTISAAHVSGRTHPELETEDILWGRAWRQADSIIQCRFHRNNLFPNRFSLNQSYFLFLADGRAEQGLIHRHDHQPLISTNQKAITGHPEDLCGSRSPLLIKFHGVLMLAVWMWAVSTAVFIARHYKNLRPDVTLLGERVWFQLHRTMMASAVVAAAAAFTLPFIYRRGWSKRAGSHPYIGCVVMALSVIQPIIAGFCPAPESPRRIIFSWIHFGTGTICQILAAVCVFLGPAQQALLLPTPWSPAVMTGWLLWILLADLCLLIHSCRLRRRGSSDGEEKILFPRSDRQQHGEVCRVKTTVLLLFLMGNTGFLAAFIQAIASV